MKVHITLRLELEDRKALANHYGKTNPVGANDVRTWAEGIIRATLQDIRHDYQLHLEGGSGGS